MSEVVSFRLPDDVSKDDVREEADTLGYASVNQYLMDVFRHREELLGGDSPVNRIQRQIESQEDRMNHLEKRIQELEKGQS